jgi:hypothetical protein
LRVHGKVVVDARADGPGEGIGVPHAERYGGYSDHEDYYLVVIGEYGRAGGAEYTQAPVELGWRRKNWLLPGSSSSDNLDAVAGQRLALDAQVDVVDSAEVGSASLGSRRQVSLSSGKADCELEPRLWDR